MSRTWSGRDRKKEHGAILYLVAASLFVLVGFLGLAIDLGHMYNNKGQLQNMADAGALSGATALNGTSGGIQLAVNRARDLNSRLNNKTEFNTQNVTLAEANITFSDQLNGTYVDKTTAQGSAATIRFVRVVIPPQQTDIVFAKLVPGIPSSLNFGAEAVAGQAPQILASGQQAPVCNGLDPFSPPALNLNDPTGNFGYVKNQYYSIRMAPGNSPQTCTDNGITNSTTGNWNFADPNGCGNGQPCLKDSIMNGSQNSCVPIGPGLPAVPGDRGINIPRVLQTRFDQDTYTASPLFYDTYITSSNLNYRRIIRTAINDGNIPNGAGTYNVVGYGCFYMVSRPVIDPGGAGGPAAAICMLFVGSCDINGVPTPNGGPGSTSTSSSITKLVLFR